MLSLNALASRCFGLAFCMLVTFLVFRQFDCNPFFRRRRANAGTVYHTLFPNRNYRKGSTAAYSERAGPLPETAICSKRSRRYRLRNKSVSTLVLQFWILAITALSATACRTRTSLLAAHIFDGFKAARSISSSAVSERSFQRPVLSQAWRFRRCQDTQRPLVEGRRHIRALA